MKNVTVVLGKVWSLNNLKKEISRVVAGSCFIFTKTNFVETKVLFTARLCKGPLTSLNKNIELYHADG